MFASYINIKLFKLQLETTVIFREDESQQVNQFKLIIKIYSPPGGDNLKLSPPPVASRNAADVCDNLPPPPVGSRNAADVCDNLPPPPVATSRNAADVGDNLPPPPIASRNAVDVGDS